MPRESLLETTVDLADPVDPAVMVVRVVPVERAVRHVELASPVFPVPVALVGRVVTQGMPVTAAAAPTATCLCAMVVPVAMVAPVAPLVLAVLAAFLEVAAAPTVLPDQPALKQPVVTAETAAPVGTPRSQAWQAVPAVRVATQVRTATVVQVDRADKVFLAKTVTTALRLVKVVLLVLRAAVAAQVAPVVVVDRYPVPVVLVDLAVLAAQADVAATDETVRQALQRAV